MRHTIRLWASQYFARLLILAACLLLPLHGAEWRVETVDPGGGGKWSTLLFDKAGNAHVSYANESLHELRYGFWDHNLRKWFTMVIDDHSQGFVSMALDSQQRPHIAYLNYGAPRIKYAHWDGAWKVEELNTGATLMEYYTGIAMDAHDQPFISYYEILRPGTLDYVLHLRTIHRDNNVWEVTRVDGTPGSGKFNSLASNEKGQIVIAYANVKEENSSLRFARWTGSGWDREILIGAEGPRHIFSVKGVLGEDGTPHICFTDLNQRTIRYATKRGGHWEFEDVSGFAREAFPDRNGLALDEEGNPYITFVDAGVGALKFAYRRAGKWMVELINGSASGFTSSIQVSHGEIAITYYDAASNSLNCYRRPLELSTTAARSAGQ